MLLRPHPQSRRLLNPPPLKTRPAQPPLPAQMTRSLRTKRLRKTSAATGIRTRDAASRSAASPAASGTGAAGKDKPQEKAKDKEPAAPDDAEISRWAQNLRPEDF